MRKLLLFMLCLSAIIKLQAQIAGSLNPATSTKFQFLGNFMGFNDGPFTNELGMGINATTANSCGGCDGAVHPVFYDLQDDLQHYHRFPGGQAANYYHRWYGGYGTTNNIIANNPYYIVSNTSYLSYLMRSVGPQPAQSNNNVVFPFINKLTHNKTGGYSAESNFVVNLLEHYRKYTLNGNLYNPRYDVFAYKSIIESITTKAQLDANTTLSTTFKQIVQENLDALKTLLDNNVVVKNIELGNEFSGNGYFDATSVSCIFGTLNNNTLDNYNKFIAGDDITKLTGGLCSSPGTAIESTEQKLFYHVPVTVNVTTYDARTTNTLDCFAALCKMYVNIIKNYFPGNTFKFGMPFGAAGYNTTFSIWTYGYQNNPWNNYLVIPKKTYIGYDAVVIHSYPAPADSISMTLNNDAYFAAVVPKLDTKLGQEISRSALDKYAASLPNNTEIWMTEWNWSNANYSTTNNSLRFNNTMLDVYGKSEYLFSMIDGNTFNSTKKNLYKLANHHMFNANISNGGVTNYGTVLVNLPYGGTLFKRAAYYAFKLMQPVIDNKAGYQYNTIANAGFTSVPAGVKFRSFYKSGGNCNYDVGELLLYYANTSGTEYTININNYLAPMFTSNPTYYIPSGLVYNYGTWANKLYASCGASYSTATEPGNTDAYFISNPTDALKNIQIADGYLTTPQVSSFTIKKYAVGYLRIPIRQTVGIISCAGRLANPNTTLKSEPENKFNIYPNPAKDKISIDLFSTQKSVGNIEIYNMEGKMVQIDNVELLEGNNSTQIDISPLPSASYIVKINYNETSISKKIEIVK